VSTRIPKFCGHDVDERTVFVLIVRVSKSIFVRMPFFVLLAVDGAVVWLLLYNVWLSVERILYYYFC